MFPKIIHQVWFDFNNGVSIDADRQELIQMNKHLAKKNDYAYEFWSLSRANEFIEKNYPFYISFMKKKWKNEIIKCDFFRYLIMYHYGGLYVDLDFGLTQSFAEMNGEENDKYDIVLFEEWYESANMKNTDSSEGSLHNGFLLSQPKQDFWLKMMNNIVSNSFLITTKSDVWKLSGTNLLRNFYIAYNDGTIIHRPYFLACPFKSVSRTDPTKQVLCTNESSVPMSLQESSWKFFTLKEFKTRPVFESCHAACIGVDGGSLWTNI